MMDKSKFTEGNDKVKGMLKKESIQSTKDKVVEQCSSSFNKIKKILNKEVTPRGYILFEGKSVAGLVKIMKEMIQNTKNMELNELVLEDGSIILQARVKKGELKQFVGLDYALTVHIKDYKNGQIEIQLGDSRWMDKAFAFSITCFVFWPLVLSPSIGSYQQIRLKNDMEKLIDDYFEIT